MSETAGNAAARPVILSLAGLSKNFGETAAVQPTSLDIPEGEFLTIVGPSGKTQHELRESLWEWSETDRHKSATVRMR